MAEFNPFVKHKQIYAKNKKAILHTLLCKELKPSTTMAYMTQIKNRHIKWRLLSISEIVYLNNLLFLCLLLFHQFLRKLIIRSYNCKEIHARRFAADINHNRVILIDEFRPVINRLSPGVSNHYFSIPRKATYF